MRVKVLASAPEQPAYQYLTTFLVNDTVAIDAGCVGLHRGPAEQARIAHVFLTHSHADHVLSLPLFLNNVYEERQHDVVVHGHADVLESLRTDIFNDRVWPNVLRLSDKGRPLVQLDELAARRPVVVSGLSITPVPVSHVVPTFGYIVDDGTSAVVFSSDSRATDEIWDMARSVPHLKAAFVGVAFPDEEAELAETAGHLSPRAFRREAAKLPEHVQIVAIHIKPTHAATVIGELLKLGLANLTIGTCGEEYVF